MSDPGRRLLAGWNRFEEFWFRPADTRVYALLRIAFAVVALLNLIDLWPHRAAFFSRQGMVDLGAVQPEDSERIRFSLFFLVDSPGGVTAIFLGAAAAMICLAMGWWSRVMIILVFAWQLSYSYRAIPVVHGWDVLLRIQAFILMFSPLGLSARAWWRSGWGGAVKRSAALAPGYGLVLTQIQLAVIYWQTVWLKVADPFWRDGEFLSHFMLSLYSRFPDGRWENWQMASELLTYLTLVVEIAVPLLLWNRRTRWLGLVAGFGLHFSILFVSHIWLFSLAVLVPYLAFLEGNDLDRWARKFRREQKWDADVL